MRCVDVNVLVYAHRQDLDEHRVYQNLLETLANDDQALGLPDAVLSGVVAIVTNRKIFAEPTPAEQAWSAVDDLLAAPAAMRLRPGERHWSALQALCADVEARGNDVPDAYLAAYAVENNAEWLSADQGFARFRRLRWSHPLGS
jgi:toxin-antitoxin system PIN domain toxin